MVDWYEDTPMEERNEAAVKWEAHHLGEDGYDMILQKEEGNFRFLESGVGQEFLIVGYSHEPELNNASAIKVKIVSGEKREILGIDITDINDKPISENLHYGKVVNVKVRTTGTVGEILNIDMWEDDAKGAGHSEENKYNKVDSQIAKVGKKGVAEKQFTIKPDFAKIAEAHNKKEGSTHEYYFTVFAGEVSNASGNINVYAPDYVKKRDTDSKNEIGGTHPKVEPVKSIKKQPIVTPTPNTPEGKATPRPAPTPRKPETVKKELVKVYVTDGAGKAITGTYKGTQLKVWIESTGLVGNDFRMKVYDKDLASNDLILDKKDKFVADKTVVNIDLSKVPRSLGGDYFYQNWFVDVEVLETKAHVLSKTVDVDVSVLKVDIPDNETKGKIGGTDTTKTGTCACKEFDLIWGNKVNCDFRKKVVDICKELWGEDRKKAMANGLMGVMYVETSGSFKAHQIMGKSLQDVTKITKDDFILTKKDGTKTSRAVGLIQFTQAALEQIGEFEKGSGADKLNEIKLKFAQMGEIKQLDYVKKYFSDSKDKIKSPEDIYLHVFAPIGVGQKDDFVLYESGTSAYTQNKSIDEENNSDGKIQRSEILGRYNTSVDDGKYNKERKFSCGAVTPVFNAKDVITFRVYNDGRIEKHIPKAIKSGFETKYKYVYHDKNKEVHEICTVDFINAQDWDKGSKNDGGKGWEKRIAESKTRYYKKGEGTNELIKMPLPLNYTKKDLIIKLADNTVREYVNPTTFGSIIGAIAECNYSDVTMNGFTSEDATGAPSVSHINGKAGDFRYLRKDATGAALNIFNNPGDLDIVRQEKLIDAFRKFGFISFLSYNITINKKSFILKKCKHLADHDDHIHLNKAGYNPDFIEIKEK